MDDNYFYLLVCIWCCIRCCIYCDCIYYIFYSNL